MNAANINFLCPYLPCVNDTVQHNFLSLELPFRVQHGLFVNMRAHLYPSEVFTDGT